MRRCLVEAGISFARVHPNQVVAFRQRRWVRAKTDRIDARLLAAFAADELARRVLAPMIEGEEVLRELAVRRRQLLATLHAERCRRELAESPVVRDSLAATIAALESSLAAVIDAIRAHIAATPAMAENDRRLQTLTGVGPIIAMTLLADLPELGRLSGKKIAASAVSPRTTGIAASTTAAPPPAMAGQRCAWRSLTAHASLSASTRR